MSGRRMEVEPASALLFGGVHGFVGVPEQFVLVFIIRGVEGNADTYADRDTMRPDVKWRANRFYDSLRDNQHIVFA